MKLNKYKFVRGAYFITQKFKIPIWITIIKLYKNLAVCITNISKYVCGEYRAVSNDYCYY